MFLKNVAAISRYGYIYAHRNLKNIDITGSEHSIVIYLSRHDGVNQESISEALMLDKGTIAKNLAQLEEKNFITRVVNQENRREKIISLTEYGKSVVNVVLNVSEKWEIDVLNGLTPQEKDAFHRLSEKIAYNAKMIADNNGQERENERKSN